MIKVLYPCDPTKNTNCRKDVCQELCFMTSDPTSAKDKWKFSELQIVPEGNITLADAIIIKTLMTEGEK